MSLFWTFICAPLSPQVAETCQLAVRRLEWLQQHSGEPAVAGPYLSVDPAPPAEERDVGRLREVLLDEGQPLFDRYRAMFALRDAGGEEAALALAEGESGPGEGGGGHGQCPSVRLSGCSCDTDRASVTQGMCVPAPAPGASPRENSSSVVGGHPDFRFSEGEAAAEKGRGGCPRRRRLASGTVAIRSAAVWLQDPEPLSLPSRLCRPLPGQSLVPGGPMLGTCPLRI